MEITGPAAGHARLQTSADQTGRHVRGMINNCAGGITPWGTWLSCEENFNGYFSGQAPGEPRRSQELQALRHRNARIRLGQVPRPVRSGQRSQTRPIALGGLSRSTRSIRTGCRRSGPRSAGPSTRVLKELPIRTAATSSISGTMNASITSTNSSLRVESTPKTESANRTLLDRGTLYVAKYNPDGSGVWMPLVHGQGPLTASQRVREPGRCAHRDAAGRRPSWGHQDGSSGRHRSKPPDEPRLCHADEQHASQG